MTQSMKSRGAGASASRKYTWQEWAKGYAAWLLVLPIYIGLWAFAKVFKRVPNWLLRKLLRNWHVEVGGRDRDVRIPGDPGIDAYMLRWWKIKRNAFFNIYYHLVLRSDEDAALHDHPWWNFSIVLEGGYYEHLIREGGVHEKTWYPAGSVRFRRSGAFAHRLELMRVHSSGAELPPGSKTGFEMPVKTIFITGPALRRWGFHDPQNGWVDAYDWDEHCERYGIATMKMAGYAEQVAKATN